MHSRPPFFSLDLSAIGPCSTGQNIQQRGFACSVPAQQAEQFAVVHCYVGAPQHVPFPFRRSETRDPSRPARWSGLRSAAFFFLSWTSGMTPPVLPRRSDSACRASRTVRGICSRAVSKAPEDPHGGRESEIDSVPLRCVGESRCDLAGRSV